MVWIIAAGRRAHVCPDSRRRAGHVEISSCYGYEICGGLEVGEVRLRDLGCKHKCK
jgi:hypothetical protein